MTCYMRHLGSLFETLDLPQNAEDRARVDAVIRHTLGLGDAAHCPEVWAAIKAMPPDERAELPARVAEFL